MIIASDIKISSSWGPSLRGDRFHNLGVTKCKSEVWSTHSLTHKHTTKYCTKWWKTHYKSVSSHPLFEVLSHSSIIVAVRASILTLDKLIDLKAGRRVLRNCCEYFSTWLLFPLTVGWSRGRAGHHFPKIIFLVFINCGTGVKLNKNSEIEIHSNIEMGSEDGHFWSRYKLYLV